MRRNSCCAPPHRKDREKGLSMLRPYTAVASLIAVALLASVLGWRLIVTQRSLSGPNQNAPLPPHAGPHPSHPLSEKDKIKAAFASALDNDLKGLEKALDSG